MIGRVAVLTGGALLLAACGGEGRVLTLGDVTVLVARSADAGMDALGGGRLEVVGGCLGADGVVIVWPHGTEVVGEDPVRIEIPGQGTYRLGDDVEVAGGFVREHSPGPVQPGAFPIAGITVPETCAEHDVFLAH